MSASTPSEAQRMIRGFNCDQSDSLGAAPLDSLGAFTAESKTSLVGLMPDLRELAAMMDLLGRTRLERVGKIA